MRTGKHTSRSSNTEGHSELTQTPWINFFTKINNGFKSLTIPAKNSIFDIWPSSEYVMCSFYRSNLQNYFKHWLLLKMQSKHKIIVNYWRFHKVWEFKISFSFHTCLLRRPTSIMKLNKMLAWNLVILLRISVLPL